MIRTFCYSDIGGRACNEDAVGIKTAGEDQVLAVLAAGLGGPGGGKITASLAVDTVCGG